MKVPRYHSISFLILPFIIYLALNFSLVGTVFLKEIITYTSIVIPNLELEEPNLQLTKEDLIKQRYAKDFSVTLVVIGFSVALFNLPFKIFFFKKRRKKQPKPLESRYTKLLINFSPEIITTIVLLGTIYIHYSIFHTFKQAPDNNFFSGAMNNIFIVSVFTSTLVVILVYFGQKFRVQTKYIQHVFSKERLTEKPTGFNFPGLRGRFFITTIFITFIPLIIVMFYVISSFKTVSSISALSNVEFNFLFKDWIELISMFTQEDPKSLILTALDGGPAPYIDTFGVFQLFLGIIPGLFFSLIYIFKIVSWSNYSILKPINELLVSMKSVSKGNLDSYTIVRSREETGQLSYGFNQMLNGLKERERIKSLFGQYLSAEISEEIIKGNVDLNGSMYKATILFADIRGFTTLSESITPHETISFLNEYYNVIIDVIQKYGGIIDKFMGDGILVLFGVPITSKDHADRAVNASFEIHEKLKQFNKDRESAGLFTVKIGIGIHTGDVIAGNVGNSNKLEYTVIGDTVNIASRIESLTKKFETELLIGESVYDNLSLNNKNRERFQKLDGVILRGKRVKVNLLKFIQ
ncbi:adenylate/guanylate cyclase domain-containing protein [Thiospirochaeta perfilievii]|uniref:Adenylate/guanylate cyclase domain-containing protein n=1 Tax=Thiospirochaeta perfilievii TaxID=252967 RepID=A0A5C1QC59_9SPIO|nr:adenylate/guanylate cyclase domain-containing protein [Thiospirochaeta perfilievii]QEN05131.1 adenylate/guanylate cyclase domain-containing protein [Thiospirochaeta perfilievii]